MAAGDLSRYLWPDVDQQRQNRVQNNLDPLWAGRGFVALDVVNRRLGNNPLVPVGGGKIAPNKAGLNLTTSGTSTDGWVTSQNVQFGGATSLTVAVEFTTDCSSSNALNLGGQWGTAYTYGPWCLLNYYSTGIGFVVSGASGVGSAYGQYCAIAAGLHRMVCTWSPATGVFLYLDGVKMSTTLYPGLGSAPSSLWSGINAPIYLNRLIDSNMSSAGLQISAFAYAQNYCMPAAEALALSRSPALSMLFSTPEEGIYLPASGSSISGTTATTDGADTYAFSGALTIPGTTATTDGADPDTFSGTLAIPGTTATTDSADTYAFNGSLTIPGTTATTDSADAYAFSGALTIPGTTATTDGADTPNFSGIVSAAITGTITITDGADLPFINNLGLVFPPPSQVSAGVVYGPHGNDYTGTLVAGGGAFFRRR